MLRDTAEEPSEESRYLGHHSVLDQILIGHEIAVVAHGWNY